MDDHFSATGAKTSFNFQLLNCNIYIPVTAGREWSLEPPGYYLIGINPSSWDSHPSRKGL